jgi:predicted ATPase
MPDLPTGTVTFLFTDIEGSTKLLHELGAEAYSAALADHRRILRAAFSDHGGVEVDTQGDAFFVAFADAVAAVASARAAQQALAGGSVEVRMGLHTGAPHLGPEGYVGRDVHLGARIAAAGHGGQVLLSKDTRAQLGDLFELLDLGEHRLKDFAAPVWIYQLGSDRFAPLKTISNTNLPRPASTFVGREREVADIGALLRDDARLVTLTGPGGSGKTRLAIEGAAELVSGFPSGVFWVDLAPLRDAAVVPETIGQTLGAKEGLAEHIGERQMLLVLDNLEQVVESARELSTLLGACPNLRLLTTSRELLRIRGEVEYPVPPLAMPEAVELFAARSGLAPTDTIAELCRRLDNLPLAVELAAARTGVLSPVQILDRISKRLDLLRGGRDTDPRQQTLRATIDWSYELLKPAEQTLFARMSVFRGGCTLESAEGVADADLDVLASLVDKSLLRHADERFTMLETIREYATERLESSGEAEEIRLRHAGHFLALAEEAEPHMRLFSAEWVDRLGREHDNLRAALDHFTVTGQTELLLQLAGALADFWDSGGHVAEGNRRLDDALRAQERPTPARARALVGAANLANSRGDVAATKSLAEEALVLHRHLGDRWGAACALNLLGVVFIENADFEAAREAVEECVELFRAVGDNANVVAATRTLAYTYYSGGDLARARTAHEENLRMARALGIKETEVGTLGSLAIIAVDQGRVEDAQALVRENLVVARDLGSIHAIAQALCRAADVLAVSLRKPETATRLLSCFEALRPQIGVSEAWVARMNEETLAAIHAHLDDAAFVEAWDGGQELTADDAVTLALSEIG